MLPHFFRGLLREPLVHFAFLAGLLLCADRLRPRPTAAAQGRTIVVTRRQSDELRADFARRHGRPPTADEEREEVDRFVEEEALFRTALRLGLHESDTIVRRRLVQRMRFLEEDLAQVREPTDDELRAWMAARQYAPLPRVTFDEVFFSRSRRGAALGAIARQALDTLTKGGEATSDPYPLPLPTTAATRADLAKVLGPSLAEELFTLPAGEWRGPLECSYGLLLVRVRSQSVIDSGEARQRARLDWLADKRQDVQRKLLGTLRGGFDVVRER
jgi:hypothetical protein